MLLATQGSVKGLLACLNISVLYMSASSGSSWQLCQARVCFVCTCCIFCKYTNCNNLIILFESQSRICMAAVIRMQGTLWSRAIPLQCWCYQFLLTCTCVSALIVWGISNNFARSKSVWLQSLVSLVKDSVRTYGTCAQQVCVLLKRPLWKGF